MANPECVSFTEIIDGPVEDFVQLSRAFGEPIYSMALMVKTAFEKQLQFITVGITAPKPSDSRFKDLIQPLSDAIREINEFRDRNRQLEDEFNHLSTISESIVALSWISVKPAPAQFVRDMRDAGEYYGNRVLRAHRGEENEIAWISGWNKILTLLEAYVRKFHLTGFSWNVASRTSGRDEHGLSLPPPPPPPPGPIERDIKACGDGQREALLNQLNVGENIARMLRPVRPLAPQGLEQQGIGMRGIRPAQPVAAVQSVAAPIPPDVARPIRQQASKPPVQPPKFLLEGRRWTIEYQRNSGELTLQANEMSESVQLFQCENSALRIENKVNQVVINNCKRTKVVLNGAISSVDIIRCNRVTIECTGPVPLINIDNSDCTQIFLTHASRDSEIISTKSSSSNVCLLEDDNDYVELPVPEQIKTVCVGGRLSSTVLEHN